MKTKLLNIIIDELKENKLFRLLFVECIELYPSLNNYEDLKKRYYNDIAILESFCEYIEFTSLVFDIHKLILKRFNDILCVDNIIKALNVLMVKE